MARIFPCDYDYHNTGYDQFREERRNRSAGYKKRRVSAAEHRAAQMRHLGPTRRA
jgi:hypothetical protein